MKPHSVIILNGLPDKKVKSIGNRCLVQIKKNQNILDYHIQNIRKIFKNPEIILVCAFDSKKIKKYVEQKYSNIIFLEHDIEETTNIGQSLETALKKVSHKNCLIINANHILHTTAIDKIKHSLEDTFILTSTTKCSDIGFIKSKKNQVIENCYYDLPNQLYDILYIKSNQFNIIKDIKNLSRFYFFEIVNKYIDSGMVIKAVDINPKSITIINSTKNIESIRKKLCIK
jgi:hypothetical protein